MSRPIVTLSKKSFTRNRVKQFGIPVGVVPQPVKPPPVKPPTTKQPSPPVPPEVLRRTRAWIRSILPSFPLIIGIKDDLLKVRPEGVTERAVRIVLREITSTEVYLASFEIASDRHGLDGKTEPLADQHRHFANGRMFEQLKQRRGQGGQS